MAWTTLKAAIASVIKANGGQEITGVVLQNTLNTIISNIGENATFKGIAEPITVPGAPDGKILYFATTKGIYSNFGGYEIKTNSLYLITNLDSVWTFTDLKLLNNKLVYTLQSTFQSPSNNWGYPLVNTRTGYKYILRYSGAAIGKVLNVYIVNSNALTTNLQDIIQTTLTTASGDIEFTANQNADSLRIYSNNATQFEIKLLKYNENYLSEIEPRIKDLETTSVKIDPIEKIVYQDKTLGKSVVVASSWWMPAFEIASGMKYFVKITSATPGATTLNGFFTRDSSYNNVNSISPNITLSTAELLIEFTATNAAAGVRVYITGASCNIQIYKKLPISEDVIYLNEKTSVFINSLLWNTIKTFQSPSNNWGYPLVETRNTYTYKFKYKGATIGKILNVYIVQSTDLLTVLQAILQTTLTTTDGEVIFTANQKADCFRIYSNDTNLFEMKLLEYNEAYLSELEPRVQALEQNGKTLKTIGSQPYSGLKILSLGDSYTYQNLYGTYLASATGCTQRGRGQNGGHIGTFISDSYTNPIDGTSVSETFNSALLAPYDIVTIMGGTNDYGGGVPIGSIADNISANTVYGHIKLVLDKILSIKPNIKIYFCTQPYRCPNPSFHAGIGGYTPNSAGATLEDVANAVVKCANYYGYPVFDFYHISGWNIYNNKETNPGAGYPYPAFADNIYTLDGLHPKGGNGKGADMLGTSFGRFINNNK